MIRSGVDFYVLYSIVKRLSTPFTEWKAYKVGLIDDKGNFLIDKDKRTDEQKSSMTYFDIFVMNLKKILQKIPGGNSKIATYAAALWLLREDEGGTPPIVNTSTSNIARSSEKEAKAFNRYKTKRLKRNT